MALPVAWEVLVLPIRRATEVWWRCVYLGMALIACGDEAAPDERCGPAEATVARVLDGDTVELDVSDDKALIKIRYLLVDTPEIAHNASEVAECFGDEARVQNQTLVLGKTVRLEYDVECQDRFGRTLAYVYVGTRMVNEILVERGYARVLFIKPNDKYINKMRALEDVAQANGTGLWGACSE